MPLLTAKGLTRQYGSQVVLAGVDLHIRRGERIGLVGNNGSGKSTLARILAQREEPDAGQVAQRRETRLVYLEQEPRFDPELTATQAALLGLGPWGAALARYHAACHALEAGGDSTTLLTAQAEAASEVERLGGWEPARQAESLLSAFGLERLEGLMGQLSGGERRRVALAQALLSAPDLAILDEPTNHLDADTIEWLERYLLEQYRGALLLITHDRYVLDRVVERTVELDQGQLYSYAGGFSAYLEGKAERQALTARAESNRQNLLRRELEWLRRQPKARGGKQKARASRAEAARDAGPPQEERRADLKLSTTRLGSRVIDLDDVTLEVGGRALVQGLSLKLTRGMRLGIIGPNGAGKTSLVRAILGELPVSAGTLRVGDNTRIAYFDQARSGLEDEKSVLENVAPGSDWVDWNGNRVSVYSYLERLLFPPDRQRTPVGALSGGERARVALAKLMLGEANVLILDEPTNDLDITTLASLEELLVELRAVTLVVTHDRYFLDRVATDLLVFEQEPSGERVVRHYVGGYTTYQRLRRERRAEESRAEEGQQLSKTGKPTTGASGVARAGDSEGTVGAVSASKSDNLSDQPGAPALALKKLTYAERKELDGLGALIEAAEAAEAALKAEVADPETYKSRAAEVPELTMRLAAATAEVERLMARWEELETRASVR
ncbi:MAG: ABC-F family ATP-binding cassette domain-containing protein [Polyangiaceae bacterium]|nr:ABC-F family ATP-binding cassette domain-containing protein [Polyangiaceae bacterium]